MSLQKITWHYLPSGRFNLPWRKPLWAPMPVMALTVICLGNTQVQAVELPCCLLACCFLPWVPLCLWDTRHHQIFWTFPLLLWDGCPKMPKPMKTKLKKNWNSRYKSPMEEFGQWEIINRNFLLWFSQIPLTLNSWLCLLPVYSQLRNSPSYVRSCSILISFSLTTFFLRFQSSSPIKC